MLKFRWSTVLSAIAAIGLFAATAGAQVTTGSIAGRVVDASGKPVDGAQIQVTNASTGLSRGTMTGAEGRYTVLGLEVGDGYSVTAKRIGFQPVTKSAQTVGLGIATRVDFELVAQAAQLSSVKVTVTTDPIISPNKMGAGTTITDSTLHRLPTLNRTFTDFVTLTPQVSSSGPGLSGAGANNRYNNIQIDGSTEKDLFGLGSTGQPGGQAGGKSIGIEAVKSYQVLLSPYDVRYGNFAGVLINAVTKSGTNNFTGSAYYYLRDSSLTRKQSYLGAFTQKQYGFTFGGPIVKNKVFFFMNPEFQTQNNPASGWFIGGPYTGLPPAADVTRMQTLLTAAGYKGVGDGSQRTNTNPLKNGFFRLDFQDLPWNSTLTIRDNYGHADQDVFSRGTSGTLALTDNGYTFKSDKNAIVAQLKSAFSNGNYNEVYLGTTKIRDARVTFVDATTPQVSARSSLSAVTLVSGAERSSQANQLDQDIQEITDNFTFSLGAEHRITLGTQNQWYKVRNLFGQQRYGDWTFNSLDSLAGTCATCAGVPVAQQYRIGVPAQAGTDGAVRFNQRMHSFYIQDEWTATNRLNISLGLRADASYFDTKIPLNQGVLDTLKRDTRQLPSGNWQLAPRLGFNWDVTGDGKNQLRGGVGIFTGQPAFVWMSNEYQNSGLTGYNQLTCNGTSSAGNNLPPVFNAGSIASPPTSCRVGPTATAGTVGLSAAAGGEVNLARPDLKFPQSMRYTLGFDKEIANGYIFTAEAMYTRGLNQLFYQNLALGGVQGVDRHGRVMYGPAPLQQVRVGGTYNATTAVSSGGYSKTQVYEISNSSADWSRQITVGLTRRYMNNFEASLFYTNSIVRDVQSLTSSTTVSQYQFGKSYGAVAQDNRSDLGHSVFETPHRIVFNGTYTFQPTGTDLSLMYIGESGQRFHYTYGGSSSGDMNGDGIGNDAIYVPANVRDSNEVIFVVNGSTTIAQQQDALEAFINNNKCLKDQKGQIMGRNSCSEPFHHTWNFSLRQRLGGLLGFWKGAKDSQLNRIQFQWDIFNVANFINRSWGSYPTSGFGSINLLNYSSKENGSMITKDGLGAGGLGARPRFTFAPTFNFTNDQNVSSNYRMQMAVRYSF